MTAAVGRANTSGVPVNSGRAEPAERSWFDEVVELLGSPAAIVDHGHRILAVNARFCEFCGTAPASLMGRHIRDVANKILYVPAIQEALTSSQSGGVSAGERAKRMDLPLVGGRRLAATVWHPPAAFEPAEAFLLFDLHAEQAVHRNLRALAEGAPTDPLRSLSAETLRHDVRQPLQTLSLLQGVLAMKEDDTTLRGHIVRLREAIEALGGMLDILDDLQHPNVAPPARLADLPIEPVLNRLRSEFSYHAEAKGLALRVVSSGAVVHSNSRSLEQLIRALLLAAMKMTSQGRVLLGCRPRRRRLRLEIWVGGEMIAAPQQQGILDEFHRGAPLPSERGLVPSIVKPLADTLGLRVKARSRPGTGLLFTIDVPMSPAFHSELAHEVAPDLAARAVVAAVSDNLPDREALKLLLQEAGYRVVAARYDGQIELDAMQPEVIVADFTVPSTDAVGRLIGALRELFGSDTPVVVIADEAWRTQSTRISDPVTYLAKPATAEEITSQVSLAVAAARARLATPRPKDRRSSHQTVFIVDDDHLLLDAMSAVLSARGERVEVYPDAESFLESYTPPRRGCLVVDDKLPGLRGVELLEKLKVQRATLPAIMITGHGDIATAVRAMRVGSIDYIEKPVHHAQLLTAIDRALEIDKEFADTLARRQKLAARYATLTQRERQVLDLVTKGASSKTISRSLNISQRTVESHRAAVMKRMGTGSLSELIHAVMELRLSQEE